MLKLAIQKGQSIYRQALFPYTSATLKHKVIFIHIPKAAGTSVRVALGESARGRLHLPWWVYQQASPKRFEHFYKFAFVRNPADRVFSGYIYLRSGGNQADDIPVAKHLARYESFNDFVDAELVKGKMIYHPIFRPQSWYLCDWRGKVQVNYVGKFESITLDFERVAQELKLKNFNGLPVVNKSRSTPEGISDETRRAIFDLYRDDYRLFGYEDFTSTGNL